MSGLDPRLTAGQIAEIIGLYNGPKRHPGDGGPKIDAVKRYREFFGDGLSEAKKAVERIMDAHGGSR